MSTIYVMEAANLFAGDHDPTASKHLSLAELKLPPLQEMYQDHHAGGSRVQIEVAVGISKLEPTFKLNGWDPDLLTQFGLGSARQKVFTAYGVIRDKRTGMATEAKAIIEGRLGKIEPDAFQRGELQGHEYAINEVMHYELWFNEKEKLFWDFFSTEWRLDGVSQNDDERRILRVQR
jgi:P2 family phage contractile tail tube protein